VYVVSAWKDSVMSVASGAGHGQLEGGRHVHTVSHDSRFLYVPIGRTYPDCEVALTSVMRPQTLDRTLPMLSLTSFIY